MTPQLKRSSGGVFYGLKALGKTGLLSHVLPVNPAINSQNNGWPLNKGRG